VLITRDVNSNYFKGASFVSQYLENNNVSLRKNNLTIISDASYLWIPQHVHLPANYKTFLTAPSLLIVDQGFAKVMQEHNKQGNLLHSIYDTNNTRRIAMFGQSHYNQNISIYLYDLKASNLHQMQMSPFDLSQIM
jgi:hypothetical protein